MKTPNVDLREMGYEEGLNRRLEKRLHEKGSESVCYQCRCLGLCASALGIWPGSGAKKTIQ